MRLRIVIVIVATFGLAFGSFSEATSSAGPAPGSTYVALGDSLPASFQPNGELRSGYAEQVMQLEQERIPDLRLVKLACPGERTSTIDREKKRCPYAEGTQLAQAVEVLEGGNVAFVTLQIGANDMVTRCLDFGAGAWDAPCVEELLPKIAARLTTIVGTLRDAAGPSVPILGATYHDPILFAWNIPGFDQDVVVTNSGVWGTFNDMLAETYAALDVPVADMEAAFSIADFDTIVHVRGIGDVPINVARACQWTYECSDEFFADPHPNTIGYAIATQAWEAVLATVLRDQ